MSLSQNRNIEDLSEPFKTRLSSFIKTMSNIDPMAMHEGLRSKELQAAYVKNGRSKTMKSNHLTGNAADLHFLIPPHFPAAGDSRWRQAADIASKFGISNGGIMWDWDWNHFELADNPKMMDDLFINNKVVWRLANHALGDIQAGGYSEDLEKLVNKLEKIKEIVNNSNDVLRMNGQTDSEVYEKTSQSIFTNIDENGNNHPAIGQEETR